MPIRTVLSDAAGVLFDVRIRKNQEYRSLFNILTENGYQEGMGKLREVYEPLRSRAQTDIEEADAIRMLFEYLGIPYTRKHYERFKTEVENEKQKFNLFNGVAEALYQIISRGVKFYSVTNAVERGGELRDSFSNMVIRQLEQNGEYDDSHYEFSNYVTGIISSKDVGLRKSNSAFFESVLRNIGTSTSQDIVFVGHKYEELTSAYNAGLMVISLSPEIQRDSEQILAFVEKYKIPVIHEFSEVIEFLD